MNRTYPERLPALLAIAEHAARFIFHSGWTEVSLMKTDHTGLSIEASQLHYDIAEAIWLLAQADFEHGCDSSDSPILQQYALVKWYQMTRAVEVKMHARATS
jgi:hypothetical protein